MSFLNPAGLWGLIGIPILLLIYIIRPKFQQKTVTSTFIWKLSRNYKKKRLPWQLTNLFLLMIQMLAIGAISLILARPVVVTEDGAAEKIVILDASASMQVEGATGSRFDLAKQQICDMADEMKSHGKMTVIVAGLESYTLLERSDSERHIKELVGQVECTCGEADINRAFLLAEEVLKENPAATVFLVTDKQYEENDSVKVVDVAEEAWNVAVLELRAEREENRELVFVAELASYGQDTAAAVVLYVDGVLADAQLAGLLAEEPATVEFAGLGIRDYNEARVYVEAVDAIAYDNEYYLFNEKKDEFDVLLISEEPVFLESALMAYENISVTTVASEDELGLGNQYMPDGTIVENIPENGYDLYIYDGAMPKVLPGDGSVWMIHPDRVPKGVTFKLGDDVVAEGYLKQAPDSGTELYKKISKEVSTDEVYINEYADISSALGFETIYACDDAPMILAGEAESVRAVLFAFELGASNLPLRIAFPVLMHNMLEYSLCSVLEQSSYEAGDEVTLNKVSGAMLTSVTNDTTLNTENHLRMPVSFVTEEPGRYTVAVAFADETVEETGYFVHLSPEESNITAAGGALPEFATVNTETNYEKEITWWFVVALLLLVVLEWGLQYREQF